MLICETLLCMILLVVLPIAARSDLKKGIVSNILILIAGLAGFTIDVIYYLAFAGEYFFPFFMNSFLTAVLSIFFYSQGIWGAGDSKLLILISLCLPGRIFCRDGLWSFPGLLLISIIFTVSFVVVFIDSIIKKWKKTGEIIGRRRSLFQIDDLRGFLKKTLFMYFCVGAVNGFFSHKWTSFLHLTYPVLLALDLVIILLLNSKDWTPTLPSLLTVLVLFLLMTILSKFVFSWQSFLFSLVFIVALLFVRSITNQENYQMISAGDILPGMILDYSSVALLNLSKATDLPSSTTADMRSRLHEKEVAAIHAWGKKHPGHDQLVIIRKIPFALFIAIGTLIFWGMEVLLKYECLYTGI